MTKVGAILPGEPVLAKAILAAAQANGARYVHRYDGIEGWHTSASLPHVPAYFRVSCNHVYVRTRDTETYFGQVVGGQLIQDGKVEATKPIR
jgi:hypothetical protein